ncbi:Tyrosine-Protein Kinase Zap-70 [Manis pentadactyla]|nr:Tyrosine-Protein Kinase Zap-70 [Manis pentadactyla]
MGSQRLEQWCSGSTASPPNREPSFTDRWIPVYAVPEIRLVAKGPVAGQEVSSWGEALSQKSIHRAPSTSGHESCPGTHTSDGRHGAERGNSAHRELGRWDLVTEVGSLHLRKPCPDLGSGPPPPGPA